jgi:RNA-directed DNA polymerase
MVAKLETIKVELLHRKHDRISQVGAWLRKVVTGYYQYHSVPGNIDQLRAFRQRVIGSGGMFWFVAANAQRRSGSH